MPFNYSKLRGKIKELYKTQADFANALNMGTVTLSARLNNYVEWNQSEILKAVELLRIDVKEIPEYFFTLEVQKTEQK